MTTRHPNLHQYLLAGAAALALTLTACGGDTEAEEATTSENTTTSNLNSGQEDGFDTPADREHALIAYACDLMDNYETSYVVNNAYHTIENDEFGLMPGYLWVGPDAQREAASDNLTATLSKYGSEQWHATCREDSEFYREWIKKGWAEFVNQDREFTRDIAESEGVLDSPQYALESSGEADR